MQTFQRLLSVPVKELFQGRLLPILGFSILKELVIEMKSEEEGIEFKKDFFARPVRACRNFSKEMFSGLGGQGRSQGLDESIEQQGLSS
jgi:hypothetical protein